LPHRGREARARRQEHALQPGCHRDARERPRARARRPLVHGAGDEGLGLPVLLEDEVLTMDLTRRELLILAAAAAPAPLSPVAQADGAFRVLYERYKDEIHGFLFRLLRDDARAEDVLQETFFRVYKALETFDASRSFRAWLYQITRNAAIDAIRQKRKDERIVG